MSFEISFLIIVRKALPISGQPRFDIQKFLLPELNGPEIDGLNKLPDPGSFPGCHPNKPGLRSEDSGAQMGRSVPPFPFWLSSLRIVLIAASQACRGVTASRFSRSQNNLV